jgi:hypothetical protein
LPMLPPIPQCHQCSVPFPVSNAQDTCVCIRPGRSCPDAEPPRCHVHSVRAAAHGPVAHAFRVWSGARWCPTLTPPHLDAHDSSSASETGDLGDVRVRDWRSRRHQGPRLGIWATARRLATRSLATPGSLAHWHRSRRSPSWGRAGPRRGARRCRKDQTSSAPRR